RGDRRRECSGLKHCAPAHADRIRRLILCHAGEFCRGSGWPQDAADERLPNSSQRGQRVAPGLAPGPFGSIPGGHGHHGHEGMGTFWDRNFGSVSRFHFRIPDSFANGPCCANIASITMWLGDSGATITVDCVVIYTVDDDGRIPSIRAHWEPERAMATLTR